MKILDKMFYLVFNIITLISLISIFIILFFRRGIINKVLAIIMINPGINFLNNIIILSGGIEKHSYIVFVACYTAAFYAPLVYWYCRMLMGKKFYWHHPLHILTLFLFVVNTYFWIQFLHLSAIEKSLFLEGIVEANYPWQLQIINYIFTYIQLIYSIFAFIEVYRFRFRSKYFFSDIEKIRLQYLVTFVSLSVGLTILLAVLYALLPTHEVEYFYIPFIIQITFLYVVVFAFQKNAVFTFSEYSDMQCRLDTMQRYEAFDEPLCKELKGKKKDNRFRLLNAEIDNVYPLLKEKFEKEKIYRDANLSLSSLAEKTGICAHVLTAVIKHRFSSNFFDLINSYRILEIEKNLKNFDPEKDTIETLAYKVGFNSKSAFYRSFRKVHKMTPKQYLDQMSISF